MKGFSCCSYLLIVFSKSKHEWAQAILCQLLLKRRSKCTRVWTLWSIIEENAQALLENHPSLLWLFSYGVSQNEVPKTYSISMHCIARRAVCALGFAGCLFQQGKSWHPGEVDPTLEAQLYILCCFEIKNPRISEEIWGVFFPSPKPSRNHLWQLKGEAEHLLGAQSAAQGKSTKSVLGGLQIKTDQHPVESNLFISRHFCLGSIPFPSSNIKTWFCVLWHCNCNVYSEHRIWHQTVPNCQASGPIGPFWMFSSE